MPLRRLKLIVSAERAGVRLDETVTSWLTTTLERAVSKAKARKLIMAGAVRLNGRPARNPSQVVPRGAAIEAGVDVEKLFADATSRDRAFELTLDRILFEDDDLIVVDKPAGLPSQPTIDDARDNLLAAVTRFLAVRDGSEKPYVGVHHRLDRDTSGVVLFTKSRRVNAATSAIFSDHLGVKIYHALTVAPPDHLPSEWSIRNRLGRVASRSKRPRYGAVTRGGAIAETAFRVMRASPRGLWLEAIPKTGRTHQIRVHLAEYGLPIVGDDLYGEAVRGAPVDQRAPRLMLHAAQLMFPHPMTRRETSVTSPMPADFTRCLARIGSSVQG